ncbi:MAG: biotin--[acetyl-CoA-carboxylase] ligase [Mariprofundaceae bacterium]
MHAAREHILSRLSSSSEPVSGDVLAGELQLSRAGVWKHIQSLRRQGADIVAMAGRGYVLNAEVFSPGTLQARLQSKLIGREIRILEETDSTNRQAMLAAEQDADEGLVIFARRQSHGRGRLGRTWHTLPEALACSVLLRPALPPEKVPQLSLLTAVALHQALSALAPDLRIKWPNDLLFHGAKLAGILTEMRAEPGRVHAVVLGFGINLYAPADGWPADIRQAEIGNSGARPPGSTHAATDLASISSAPFSRLELAATILNALDEWYHRYLEQGFAPVHQAWWQAHAASGQKVRVHDGSDYIEGIATALDADGALLLQTAHGTRRIMAGDLELM